MPRPRARLDPAALTRAFAPDGLHGATATAIANSVGVAKPTVYAHGGSKEALFLACVEAEVERLLSIIADADLETRGRDLRARVAALGEAIIDHGRLHPAAARLLHLTARHTGSRVAADVDAALARLPARLVTILRRDATTESAELIAPALLGAAGALALGQSGGPAADDLDGQRASDADMPERQAAMLGEAFAAVLEPVERPGLEPPVQSVDLY